MNIIYKFFSLCFTFLILILNNSEFAYAVSNVDWLLLKENNDGKEWIDMGSIKEINAEEITVLTKFLKNPNEPSDKEELSLYVMRINCKDKTYKDTSINGIPQFGSKWQTFNNDEPMMVLLKRLF
jgi:hypothetical protein